MLFSKPLRTPARRRFIYYGFIAAAFFFAPVSAADSTSIPVNDYELRLGYTISSDSGDTSIVLRRFRSDSVTRFLAVNPRTLATAVFDSGSHEVTGASWDEIFDRFGGTPYIRELLKANAKSASLQDAGITHFPSLKKGIDLTIDLCPSSRPLDRILFTKLIIALGKERLPAPVALAITGTWIREHASDLAWLVELMHSGVLAITWINHTYHHFTSSTLPLRSNFMLTKGVAVDKEVLDAERELLKRGLMPSIFFRFPGLVSDSTLFHTITEFGLIPIGSDAWLAKGQYPSGGSIVLIHGNGNEPLGVHRFIKLLNAERDSIAESRWQLYDLRKSLTEDSIQ
jgi:peptidoglycan/xylan/chitin deacetylase (PgdA/CDA1 family)